VQASGSERTVARCSSWFALQSLVREVLELVARSRQSAPVPRLRGVEQPWRLASSTAGKSMSPDAKGAHRPLRHPVGRCSRLSYAHRYGRAGPSDPGLASWPGERIAAHRRPPLQPNCRAAPV